MAGPQNEVHLSSEVHDQLLDVRSQLQNFSFCRGAVQYAILALLGLIAVGAVDYFFPLPWLLRSAVLLSSLLAGLVALVIWLKKREDVDELSAAKEIERANPKLGQRLRTSHQFASTSNPSEAPQLTHALVEQTNEIASATDLANPIPWTSLGKWGVGLGAIMLATFCALGLIRETRTTLARMLMLPVHYSTLSMSDMEPIVAGSDANFSVVAAGRPLQKVELWTRDSKSTEWTKRAMLPPDYAEEEPPEQLLGELVAKVEECQDDLVYKIVAAPLPSSAGKLKVLQPLEQTGFHANIDPPSYTGEEEKQISEMQFTVVEGSVVDFKLELSREPSTTALISLKTGQPVNVLRTEHASLIAELSQLEESQSYEVRAVTSDGMNFTSEPIRIRVRPDKGPTVSIRKPKEELSVLATTEVGLNLQVNDDYGLGKVGIEYQVNDGERQILWQEDLQGQKKQVVAAPVLFLEDHQLTHEDAISYFAFAEDNRPEPKRTRSPLQFIDIQPYKRAYQVVDANCKGGSCNSLTLEELIKRQRHNLRRTFANLDRQPIQDSLAKRLALSQSEIQAATEEFTTYWELEFGPMPMLHAAMKAMKQATVELENKALDPAMPLEETALANLVRAKQNVRKFLKNCQSSNAGQFSQCKNYDTSMAQRIRQPKKQGSSEEQSLAEAREQIQNLAEKQQRFSEEVSAANGGAKLEKKAQSAASSQAMAQSQRQSAQQAQQMQQAMKSNRVASELAQRTMEEAAEKIEQSSQEIAQGQALSAAEKAKQAAELLEQLDEHLKGLGNADYGQRLALVEQMATRLADAESEMAGELESSTEDATVEAMSEPQDRLADRTEVLADLLRHLEADAVGENPALRQGLEEIQIDTAPDELAQDMHRIAQQLANQKGLAAGKGAKDAAGQLNRIATGLGALRRGVMQPQLDELLAAEAAAAELLQTIRKGASQNELNERYERLQERLSDVNVAPGVANAAPIQPSVGQRSGGYSSGPASGATEPQFAYAGRVRNAELREVLKVLQAKIQDAILLTAMMDADEPVPAKYRDLVDEYYQTLSDDLR